MTGSNQLPHPKLPPLLASTISTTTPTATSTTTPSSSSPSSNFNNEPQFHRNHSYQQNPTKQSIKLPPLSFISNNNSNNKHSIQPQQSNTQPILASSITSKPTTIDTYNQSLHHHHHHQRVPSFDIKDESIHQTPPVILKEEITKPDIELENDEGIIKYYGSKYGINDFTNEEKHDILQHEKRARIEKAKNPNYKTYLCYSIIKRLNAIPPTITKTSHSIEIKQNQSKNSKNFSKREIKIDNTDVLKYSLKFKRLYLGSILYTPFPTKSTYKQLSIFTNHNIEDDDNKIVPLLPELNLFINSIITIRIPSYYITDLANNKNFIDRNIWGTDIYTDDSDILLILKHNGFIPIQNSELENLIPQNLNKSTPGNIDNFTNIKQTVSNFNQFINILSGDIHVDLIILPRLIKYQGIYRNGLNSRSWNNHDGVSIAIHGIRYGDNLSSIDSINSWDLKIKKLKEEFINS
ncbi:hypothetical protein WICMUC_004989 [Wickerhamomyces mucosus]|uniref:Uncharacterized protein n=1 Tax=Wickerhamomyces mucosus TaxID=1378264 RepID=A0A9P8PCH0_9ASCO|nr:hypothetical protein WICMUC_004989 [Wickerhamomyces mucosus]